MIEHSLVEDVSKLTTIPTYCFSNLSNKSIFCICDSIQEAILSKEEFVTLDIGIGKLKLDIKEDSVSYRFEPSKELEQGVIDTVQRGKNPLVAEAEALLVKRLLNTYKDYI